MSKLKHYYGLNHPNYLTTSIRRGRSPRPSIDGFDSERFGKQWAMTFAELRQESSFRIVGYVPMAEHFHAPIGPRPEPRTRWYWAEVSPSEIMQKLEDRTAFFIVFWSDASVLAMDTMA
ncbi:MAG: hypothetical protein ABSH01_09480 [Terriglobia bacterium]